MAENQETKQCSGDCKQFKPLNQFYKNRGACKDCVNVQRAQATLRRAQRLAEGQANDTQPEEIELQPVPSQVSIEDIPRQTCAPSANATSFTTRDEAEAFISSSIVEAINTLEQLCQTYSQLTANATNSKEKKEYAAKLETATAKKLDLSLKLIKNFDLFSELSKPVDDDPLYTPVHLYISSTMPASCIVQPQFSPEDDEIQPDLSSSDS